jgi:DNA-binding NtrC family response regulator
MPSQRDCGGPDKCIRSPFARPVAARASIHGESMTTLLYVDDEETIGRAVARWFGRRGHTVYLAPSVADAQAVIAEHDVDALFIDVWLGTESGFELMGWLEEMHPDLAERVTFVTGELAEPNAEGRVWRTLGRPVLQKPFDFRQLEQYVDEAVRRDGT